MKSKFLWMTTLAVLAFACLPVLAQDGGDEGDAKFKVKGEVRFRGEFVSNYNDFSDDVVAPADDDDFNFFPYRVRLGMWGAFTKNVEGYIEFQTGDAAGLDSAQRDVITTTNNDLELYMGFLKLNSVGGSNLDLTIGRQEVVFDNELFLGDLDFYNGISHDGFRADWNTSAGPLSVFWYHLNETFQADADADFFGGHFTFDNVFEDGDIGVYAYYLRDDGGMNTPPASGVDRVDLLTIGGRTGREVQGSSGLMWNAEIAIQTGTLKNSGLVALCADECDIFATVIEGAIGWNFNVGDRDHLVFGRIYSASGDDDAADDELGTFQPLFQDFHNRLGIADIVRGVNVAAGSIGYQYKMSRTTLGVEIFNFMVLEPETDAVYVGDTSGVPGRFGRMISNGVDESDLGQEIDFTYDYAYSKHLSFGAGLGVFAPGEAIKLALASDDSAVRIYGQARLRF